MWPTSWESRDSIGEAGLAEVRQRLRPFAVRRQPPMIVRRNEVARIAAEVELYVGAAIGEAEQIVHRLGEFDIQMRERRLEMVKDDLLRLHPLAQQDIQNLVAAPSRRMDVDGNRQTRCDLGSRRETSASCSPRRREAGIITNLLGRPCRAKCCAFGLQAGGCDKGSIRGCRICPIGAVPGTEELAPSPFSAPRSLPSIPVGPLRRGQANRHALIEGWGVRNSVGRRTGCRVAHRAGTPCRARCDACGRPLPYMGR